MKDAVWCCVGEYGKKKKVRERTAMGSLDFCIKSSIYSQC